MESAKSAKSAKKELPPIREPVHLEEKTQIEGRPQEKRKLDIKAIAKRIKKQIKNDPKQPPQEFPASEILPKEINIKETPPEETASKKKALKVKDRVKKIEKPTPIIEARKMPSQEIVVKEIPPKNTLAIEESLHVKDRIRRIENQASRIKEQLSKTKKPIKIERGTVVEKRVKAIETKPHIKIQLKELDHKAEEKDTVEPTETIELTETDLFIKRESQIADEVKDLMFYYQTDFGNLITKAIVYLSITSEYHFMIEIDFTDYPKRPKLKIPSKIIELFVESGGDVFQNIPTLFSWDATDPGRVYQIIAEIEYVLMKTYRTKTDKPEKVPIEINIIPEKFLQKISSIIPTLQKIGHFLAIIIMFGVLSLSMSGVNPLIPIIALLFMIGVVYVNGDLEIDFSPESFNPGLATLEEQEQEQEHGNQIQEENPRLTRSAAEALGINSKTMEDQQSDSSDIKVRTAQPGTTRENSPDVKNFHEKSNKEEKQKSNRGHNLIVGMLDGDNGRKMARDLRRVR